MTYKELISSVTRLGFESELEDETLFRGALSRGLYTIFNDRPVLAHGVIIRRDYGGRLLRQCFTHDPRNPETITLPVGGGAYSFRIYGEGGYSVGSGEAMTEHSFSGEGVTVRGFYSGEAKLIFRGDRSYTVTSLAAFCNSFGTDPAVIPLIGEDRVIDLRRELIDFLAPEDAPRDYRGEVIAGAEIEGGRLILPDGFKGEVHITYRRIPKIPLGLPEDEVIDIPVECTELLPLIVASYVWLDDEPERAQYYLSLYKDGINGLRRYSSRQISPSYTTNGWA